ncbi:MAG: NAD(+) synthase [Treponema sp.]
MDSHSIGFYRIAALVPPCTVGGCRENAVHIIRLLNESAEKGTDIAVFPALTITSASCGDVFSQRSLLDAAEAQLLYIVRETAHLPLAAVIGLPFFLSGSIYNAAAVISRGTIFGLVPLDGSDYSSVFSLYGSAEPAVISGRLQQDAVPFGNSLLFEVAGGNLSFTVGEGGAALCIEPLACPSHAGSFTELCRRFSARSKEAENAYLFVNAGWGESTTDTVCAGERGIYENGELLAAASGFELVNAAAEINAGRHFVFTGYGAESGAVTLADIDCEAPRRRGRILPAQYRRISIPAIPSRDLLLLRPRNPHPFIPLSILNSTDAQETFFLQTAEIQARGLAKRLHHTGCRKTVVGISGGLDSTLALLIAVLAARMLGYETETVTAITMPGFGTTKRTKNNALRLAELLGCTVLTIPIEKAMLRHFTDIGHPAGVYDTVYENAQARERTQILMDKANQLGALLVGTGDLSEAALGWETYNGDHMSMYNVNAGIPKTLLSRCIRYCALHPVLCTNGKQKHISRIIQDILDTPISPELLPAEQQTIVQKTEEILGPYELHDFFLYYVLHTDFTPVKIFLLAEHTFCTVPEPLYDRPYILKCLKIFYRRFFSQQFKRSCAPDGVQAGFGSFSPRGAWRMPSDMSADVWLGELENLPDM